MGVTKTQNFTEEQNQLAAFAKAFAHPARVAILQYLLKQQTCICSNLVEELPLAQATISQHLKELKLTGLIKGEIEGTSVCYCINEPMWNQAKAKFWQLFSAPLANTCC